MKLYNNNKYKWDYLIMAKKVLIIMATYNGEKYLKEQLESIFDQKNVEVSVLVRDDGSQDRTIDILEMYKREKRIDWYTGPHLNVAKGYFDLMKKAAAYDVDYIAFSDQDDIWDLDKLHVALQALDKVNFETPALYYCGQRLVDQDMKFISNHRLNEYRNLTTRFVLSDFAGCTGVFNKKLLEEVVCFEPTYMLMHDTWILKVCLALGGKVIVDSEPHMNYRQHGGNVVGLGRSIPAYLKQVKQYLNEYLVEEQMIELIKGYGDRLVPEYREIAVCIYNYRKNLKCKKILLDKRKINFYNTGLNITYAIKVLLNKL